MSAGAARAKTPGQDNEAPMSYSSAQAVATTHHPIRYNRETGVLHDASAMERAICLSLIAGSKVGALFAHRGYNLAVNTLRAMLPRREMEMQLFDGAAFLFPFCDGYWSKLLNRTFEYE